MSSFVHLIARRTDPSTSHQALKSISDSTIPGRILGAMRLKGSMTTHEIAEHLNLSVVTVSPAIKPLRLLGKVDFSGLRRNGRNVWKLAP